MPMATAFCPWMSCTRAPGTGRPSASVTTPRTTTARAGVPKIKKGESNRKAASVENLRKADARKRKTAKVRPMIEDMSETPTLPPGNVVDVRVGTGLLTYAGAYRPNDLGPSLPVAWRLQWEDPGWHSRGSLWTGARARSQLRGSGGLSPRFPNIPLRARILGGATAR